MTASDLATLLYIDDEPINLKIFDLSFNNRYKVLTAESGDKGLEALNGNPEIKYVISDMRMPRMNGIEFIKRARENYPEKSYYILSGFEITDEIREALDKNLVKRYFKKPLDVDEIVTVLKTANGHLED